MRPCPNPGKRRYTSKRAARQAIRTMNRTRAAGGHGRIHVYPCGDHWHVGHTDERRR